MARTLLFSVIVLLVLAGLIPHSGNAQDAVQRLDSLILNASDLPTGCVARPLDDGAPAFLAANPQVSADSAFIHPFGEMVFRRDVSLAGIQEALLAVYKGESEVGLFAFRFKTADFAQKARDIAAAHDEAQESLVAGFVLALIWRDGPPNTCFQALVDHTKAVLDME